MLFNSLEFVFFFPLVVLSYFALPHAWRWVLLLAASYYFYMCWKPEYALLLALSTGISYGTGLLMERSQDKRRRKAYLILSLVGNLGILFFFKYFNFLSESAHATLSHFNILYDSPVFSFLLPVGISFYVFQSLSYSMDVYRGNRRAEKHLGIFALYVSFFPQLVAGPIERSTRLLPQFFQKHGFEYQRVSDGLKLMLWGMFKKVVIADRLAMAVDHVYNNPTAHSGPSLALATYFFAFQIFCDFSGYTDIAIGSAKIMGFDLMKNFDRPYFSRSIAEFWRRWHISLSTWFKDYLYFPLGGNKVGRRRWYFNLFVVFLVSGLWHGANWTYVVWGALHGAYLVFSDLGKGARATAAGWIGLTRFPSLHKWVAIGITFHLVLFAWIFFRANSLSDAHYVITHLLTGWQVPSGSFLPSVNLGLAKEELLLAALVILLLEAVHVLQEKQGVIRVLEQKPLVLRWSVYLFLVLSILNLRVSHQAPFIYFQF